MSYSGYNMFFRFIPYAILKARQVALEELAQLAPHLRVIPLEPEENPEAKEVPLLEVAEVEDADAAAPAGEHARRTHVVSYNQKDDYVHRGPSAVLACMSLVNYSRFVRRVPRNKAGRVDFLRFFPFDEHYGPYSSSVQARLIRSCVVFCVFRRTRPVVF